MEMAAKYLARLSPNSTGCSVASASQHQFACDVVQKQRICMCMCCELQGKKGKVKNSCANCGVDRVYASNRDADCVSEKEPYNMCWVESGWHQHLVSLRARFCLPAPRLRSPVGGADLWSENRASDDDWRMQVVVFAAILICLLSVIYLAYRAGSTKSKGVHLQWIIISKNN